MQQRAPTKSLKEILVAKIENDYLGKDNPEPSATRTMWEKVGSLFAHSGADGRVRAIKYRDELLNPSKEEQRNWDDRQLLTYIFKEHILEDDSILSSSLFLRIRLLEGICAFLGITDDNVQSIANDISVHVNAAPPVTTPYAHGYSYLSTDECKKDAMIRLIKENLISSRKIRTAEDDIELPTLKHTLK